jgi:integrase
LEAKPFNDAANMYLTWCDGEYREHPSSARRIRGSFASLMAHFGGTPVTSIGAGNLEDYKAGRRASGVKEVTIRHDLHALSGFFRYASKHRWSGRNPVSEIEIPSDADAVRMHVLSDDEERRYFAACGEMWKVKDKAGAEHVHGPFPDLHDLARLVLELGLRPDDEALSLPWSAVDWGAGKLQIGHGKTPAARRTIRLTPTARAILEARRAALAGRSRWVFPGRIDGEHTTKLNRAHDMVIKHAGLSFVLYDLRHTFATRTAAAGCPLLTLARILGHASLRTIQKYVHPGQADMDEAMEKYAPSEFGPSRKTVQGDFQGLTGKLN